MYSLDMSLLYLFKMLGSTYMRPCWAQVFRLKLQVCINATFFHSQATREKFVQINLVFKGAQSLVSAPDGVLVGYKKQIYVGSLQKLTGRFEMGAVVSRASAFNSSPVLMKVNRVGFFNFNHLLLYFPRCLPWSLSTMHRRTARKITTLSKSTCFIRGTPPKLVELNYIYTAHTYVSPLIPRLGADSHSILYNLS
jgi:hypothetical protein